MATIRKLQAEIDKTFRKVDEQQEVFQQIFDRLKECDSSLKEKYEVLLLCDTHTILFRRAIYTHTQNCISHCFSFYTFQRREEERKERLFSRTRTLLRGERFVLLSFLRAR